ncbi:MAG: zinc-dependent peptidase, partial [Candidatus Aureabacteria bacterium]|nr:zinc-dependent peptidase [Candidatus Auribacterota bacterium]
GFKQRKRRRIFASPFPPAWEEMLRREVALYRSLPAGDRAELRGRTLVFLAEKNFEGCGGLVLTEEMKVMVSAQACLLLLLRRPGDYYPLLRSVLLYPHPFVAPLAWAEADGVVHEGEEARDGESWREGAVVLAWDEVKRDSRGGIRNVVLHEFAHQLDEEEGAADGAPHLPDPEMSARWSKVMTAEFEKLSRAVETGRRTFLDEYGATNAAEFFAVVTESFFTQGRLLALRHPDLYDLFRRYYNQDPAGWGNSPI